MFFFKKKCGECVSQPESKDYTALQDEVNALRRKIAMIEDESTNADFVFDFNKVNAFSIERNWSSDGQRPVTIIGYMLSEPVVMTEDNVTTKDVVREWYMYCSLEQHAKLVEQFNKAMEKNNATI